MRDSEGSRTPQHSGPPELESITKVLHPTPHCPTTRPRTVFLQVQNKVPTWNFVLHMHILSPAGIHQNLRWMETTELILFTKHPRRYWCIVKSENYWFQAKLLISQIRTLKLRQGIYPHLLVCDSLVKNTILYSVKTPASCKSEFYRFLLQHKGVMSLRKLISGVLLPQYTLMNTMPLSYRPSQGEWILTIQSAKMVSSSLSTFA